MRITISKWKHKSNGSMAEYTQLLQEPENNMDNSQA